MKCKEGENKALFGWKPFLVRWSGTRCYFAINEGFPIFPFMKDMLNHMGFNKSFPYEVRSTVFSTVHQYKEMDDWSERTDLGVINEWEKKTEIERISLWFGAFTPSSSKTQFVPEFGQFRDLVFQTKMILDYGIREANDTLFTLGKLWFTRQLLPTWEPSKGIQLSGDCAHS